MSAPTPPPTRLVISLDLMWPFPVLRFTFTGRLARWIMARTRSDR